jgi:hypothetical protein
MMSADYVGEARQTRAEFKRIAGYDQNESGTAILKHSLDCLTSQGFSTAGFPNGVEKHSLVFLVHKESEVNRIPELPWRKIVVEGIRGYPALACDALRKEIVNVLKVYFESLLRILRRGENIKLVSLALREWTDRCGLREE